VPAGYCSIAKEIAKELDIRFNTEVKTIEYSTKGVKVTSSTGETFEADYAVCTFPLGVLKSGYGGDGSV
jgi:monoamine oxidase